MTTADELKRIYWHSRRGMLEIDLALMPFAEKVYATLSEQDQATYRRLLESEDTDLFNWILQRERPDDSALAAMMDNILTYAKSRGKSF